LGKEHPLDTFIQKYWLPLIRAEIEMREGKPLQAVDTLIPVLPLEAAAPEALDICALFPAYGRGQAYLAAAEGAQAALQFQKIIDNPGMILNCPVGTLAWLGVARADHVGQQDTAAIQNYEAFFTLWKDADPDLPILKHPRSEYAKLQKN
jgi:eukaryotic-like serine/threonine-protein kinase